MIEPITMHVKENQWFYLKGYLTYILSPIKKTDFVAKFKGK